MFVIFQHLQWQLGLHYDFLATICLLVVLLVALVDYAYIVHDCDLVCWRQQLDRFEDKPMAIMLFIAGFKLLLILLMTLSSYTQLSPEIEPPIADVKRRYCRFILMRLLAARDDFLYNNQQIQRRHAALLQAIQLFRADARKLFERTAAQLNQTIQQMLPVEEQLEQKLLQLGYNRCQCVAQLRELDIYRMALSLPPPKQRLSSQ